MSVGDLATAASARTPVPTPEPGPVARKISEFTAAQGLTNQSFLGLSADDWSLLILAALFVLAGYFFLTFLLNRLLKRLVSKTSMQANDRSVPPSGAMQSG